MRLLIVGCTGETGTQLVEQALDRGHDVTGLARHAEGTGGLRPRLRLVSGDARDPATLARVFDAKYDAVLSALGSRTRHGRTDAYSAGASALIDAMTATGSRRLVAISAAGVGDGPEARTPALFARVVVPLFAHIEYADMARMEQLVETSSLDWTLVKPLWLRNGPATGDYRTSAEGLPRGGVRIRRADLAAFMLRVAEQAEWMRSRVWIAY